MLRRPWWVLGKNRAEQRQGSQPLACRLTLPVALELPTRFWQQRGEFMPVHNLNLWLLFLLLSLPLLMSPMRKFWVQGRGGKEKPQKQRTERCWGAGSNLQGATPGADTGMLARELPWGQKPLTHTRTHTHPPTQTWVPIGPGGCKLRTCPQIPRKLLAGAPVLPCDPASSPCLGRGRARASPSRLESSWRRWRPWERHP